MLIEIIKSTTNKIINFLEEITKEKYWGIKITFISFFLSLFFAFPSYDIYIKGEFKENWNSINEQIQNPFEKKDYTPTTHMANTTFRLTVPIIAKVLGFKEHRILILQIIALVLFFYFAAMLFKIITNDLVSASLATLGLAFIFPGNVLVSDLRGLFDGIAYCFILGAMYSKNPFLIFLFTILSSFTDERALIASCLVFLWFNLISNDFNNFKFLTFFKFNSKIISIFIAWITYFVIRFYLQYKLGFNIGTGMGLGLAKEQINNIPFGIWTGLEGFWILIILSLIIILKKNIWSFLIIYSSFMLTITIISISLTDITRSMAYILPAIFISLYILKEYEDKNFIRYLTLFVLIICFFFPTYYAGGKDTINLFLPFPFQLIRMIFG